MNTVSVSPHQLAILQRSIDQARFQKKKAWEIPAIIALNNMHKHLTGSEIWGHSALPESIARLQAVTGESAQAVFNKAVACVEIELLKPSIH